MACQVAVQWRALQLPYMTYKAVYNLHCKRHRKKGQEHTCTYTEADTDALALTGSALMCTLFSRLAAGTLAGALAGRFRCRCAGRTGGSSSSTGSGSSETGSDNSGSRGSTGSCGIAVVAAPNGQAGGAG